MSRQESPSLVPSKLRQSAIPKLTRPASASASVTVPPVPPGTRARHTPGMPPPRPLGRSSSFALSSTEASKLTREPDSPHSARTPVKSSMSSAVKKKPSLSISKPAVRFSRSEVISCTTPQSVHHHCSPTPSPGASRGHSRSQSMSSLMDSDNPPLVNESTPQRSANTSRKHSVSLSPEMASDMTHTRSRSQSAQSYLSAGSSSPSLSPSPMSPMLDMSPITPSSSSNAGTSYALTPMTSTGKVENIHVFVRCRPFLPHENCKPSPYLALSSPQRSVTLNYRGRTRQFHFDGVFDAHTDQSTIYHGIAARLVDQALIGYNATIFAYGQTSSGKSHTMMGMLDDSETQGIIPRSIEQIFSFVDLHNQSVIGATAPDTITNNGTSGGSSDSASLDLFYTVSLSFLEIYNEKASDLLVHTKVELEIREDNGTFFAPNLSKHFVRNREELFALIEKGNSHRNVAATTQNSRSSRSHSILTLHIDKRVRNDSSSEGSELLISSKLNLVDLAGSERLTSSTKAKQGRETLSINLSLSCLSNCIMALTENLLPSYRDSKLTRLLKDSLGGNSLCCMIACVSPLETHCCESVSTLRWAERAKRVKNQPIINDSDKADARLHQLRDEMAHMKQKMLGRNKEMIRMLWLVKQLSNAGTEEEKDSGSGSGSATPSATGSDGSVGHSATVDLDLTEAILRDPFSHPMTEMIARQNDGQSSDDEMSESESNTSTAVDYHHEEETKENDSQNDGASSSSSTSTCDSSAIVPARVSLPTSRPSTALQRSRSYSTSTRSNASTINSSLFRLFKQTMINVHQQLKTEIPPVPAFDELSNPKPVSGDDSTNWHGRYEKLLSEYQRLQKQFEEQAKLSNDWQKEREQLFAALEESEKDNATKQSQLHSVKAQLSNANCKPNGPPAATLRALSETMNHAQVRAILGGQSQAPASEATAAAQSVKSVASAFSTTSETDYKLQLSTWQRRFDELVFDSRQTQQKYEKRQKSLEEEIERLRQQQESLVSQSVVDEGNDRAQQYQSAALQSQQELEQLRQSLLNALQVIGDSQSLLASLKSELAGIRQAHYQSRQHAEAVYNQLAQQSEQSDRTHQLQLAEWDERCQSLQRLYTHEQQQHSDTLTAIQQQLRSKDTEIQKLSETVKEHEQQSLAYQRSIASSATMVAETQALTEHTRSELQDMRDQYQLLQQQHRQAALNQLETLGVLKAGHSNEVAALNAQCFRAASHITSLTEQLAALQQTLATEREHISHTGEEQRAQSLDHLQMLSVLKTAHQSEIAALNAQCCKAAVYITDLTEQLTASQSLNEQHKQQWLTGMQTLSVLKQSHQLEIAALNAQCCKAAAHIAAVTEQLTAVRQTLEDERSQFTETAERHGSTVAQLHAELSAVGQQLTELQVSHELSASELMNLQQQHQLLQSELRQTQQSLQTSIASQSSSESQLVVQQAQLQQQIAQLESVITDSQQRCQQLESQLTEAQRSLNQSQADSEAKMKASENTVNELTAKLSALAQEKQLLITDIARLQSQIQSMADYDTLAASQQQLQHQLVAVSDSLSECKHQLEATFQARTKTETALAEVQAAVDGKASELSSLSSQLESTQSDAVRLNQQLKDTKNSLTKSEQEVAELQSQLMLAQQSGGELHHSLVEQIDQLKSTNQTDRQQLTSKLASSQSALKAAQEGCIKLKAELQSTHTHLATLNEQRLLQSEQHKHELTMLHEKYSHEYQRCQSLFQSDFQSLQTQHSEQLKKMEKQHSSEMLLLSNRYQALQSSHSGDATKLSLMTDRCQALETELAALRLTHSRDLQMLEDKHANQWTELQQHYQMLELEHRSLTDTMRSHNDTKARLESQIAVLAASQSSSASSAMKALQQQLTESVLNVSRLQDQLTLSQSECDRHSAVIAALKLSHQSSMTAVQSQHSERAAAYESELSALQARHDQLSVQLAIVNTKLSVHQSETNAQSLALEAMAARKSQLKVQVAAMKQSSESERTKHQQQVAELESRITELESAIAERQQAAAKLESQLHESCTTVSSRATKDVTELTRQITEIQRETAQLLAQLRSVENERDSQYQASNATVETTRTVIQSFYQQVINGDNDSTIETLSDSDTVEIQLQRLQSYWQRRFATLQREYEGKIAALTQMIDELNNKLSLLTQEKQSLTTEIASLQSTVQSMTEDYDTLVASKFELVRNTSEEVNRMKKHVEELQQTTNDNDSFASGVNVEWREATPAASPIARHARRVSDQCVIS